MNLPIFTSFSPDVSRFFYNTVKQTMDLRRETKAKRNDLVDLMVAAVEDNEDAAAAAAAANNAEDEPEDKDLKLNHKVI